MDEIAESFPEVEIIAQIAKSNYHPSNIKTLDFMTPIEFNEHFSKAKLIVSHAGMGTIISALQQEKPIVVIPRLTKFKEHRNEHQLATAKKFDELNYIHVAYDITELKKIVLSTYYHNLKPLYKLGPYAADSLISSIGTYITSL
ncbi:Beta-1,4-galactosyltransferase [Arcticibacter svalbardensis MN12-7]|uniref:Beta-1,4-galactosyltransferase n=2 Tax=Arcticibacter TaxID=1288026 RepID=R9GRB9_9SPHI|nr:Beta-1,4-galactosyltransferase [Arcticibacter svalbardensis MN12-7]